MDALMIYHTAICQDARRPRGNRGSVKRARDISAFERSLRHSIRCIVAPFGSDVRRPGPEDGMAGK